MGEGKVPETGKGERGALARRSLSQALEMAPSVERIISEAFEMVSSVERIISEALEMVASVERIISHARAVVLTVEGGLSAALAPRRAPGRNRHGPCPFRAPGQLIGVKAEGEALRPRRGQPWSETFWREVFT
jgi:hypothetical protein